MYYFNFLRNPSGASTPNTVRAQIDRESSALQSASLPHCILRSREDYQGKSRGLK